MSERADRNDGRKSVLVRIRVTPEELAQIQANTTTDQRREALLKAACDE